MPGSLARFPGLSYSLNHMKQQKAIKLNIGCGREMMPGWINLDIVKAPWVDVVHDLDITPYPFKDNSVDVIVANDIIEHLHYPEKMIREFHRIAKPGAKIYISTSHFASPVAWRDITHRSTYSYFTFCTYENKLRWSGLNSLEVHNNNVRFNVAAKIKFGTFWKLFGMEILFNLHPKIAEIYESYFCYLIIPRKLDYVLTVVKHNQEIVK